MLKIGTDSFQAGYRIRLPEGWHDKILSFDKTMDSFPYDFIINEVVKEKKGIFYICCSKKSDDKLVFSEYAMKYLLSEEVADSNIGLSFKEYLPLEDSKILITNIRNPNEVVPGNFLVQPGAITINDKSYIYFDIIINYINGDGFTSLRYYCSRNRKFTWKFLMNSDTSYMTDYEKMFCDTLIHKEYVKISCQKLAKYLESTGAVKHAQKLLERAKVHDNSKMSCEDELSALSRIINDKSSLMDASKQLSQIKLDAIKLHWKNNTHHPEHYKSCTDMSRLDVMEMCCDWHARSSQYNTNFLEFVKARQADRFHFPEWMFAEIWHYCKVLASEP